MELVTRDEYIRTEAAHMTEGTLQIRVRHLATTLGWKFYHTRDSRGSDRGWPDCSIGKQGRFLVRELKSQKGRTTKDQREWLDILESCGIDAGIWRPLDLLNGGIERALRGEGTRER